MSPYTFPRDKLTRLINPHKTPLVLVSCGSFSPVTYLHLRMFELARDWIAEFTEFEVVGAYLSPVADAYKKKGLVGAHHRVAMCALAAADSDYIMVDEWEALQEEYTRTAVVLDHFEHEINDVLGGIQGSSKKARVALLSGADLIQTFSTPGVWAPEDLDHILLRYGAFIVERNGTDTAAALDGLQNYTSQIYIIPQPIPNDVSSTKIRQFLLTGKSVRYLIPDSAIKYITQHALFQADAKP